MIEQSLSPQLWNSEITAGHGPTGLSWTLESTAEQCGPLHREPEEARSFRRRGTWQPSHRQAANSLSREGCDGEQAYQMGLPSMLLKGLECLRHRS